MFRHFSQLVLAYHARALDYLKEVHCNDLVVATLKLGLLISNPVMSKLKTYQLF